MVGQTTYTLHFPVKSILYYILYFVMEIKDYNKIW